jgi:predicted DNA binding protein
MDDKYQMVFESIEESLMIELTEREKQIIKIAFNLGIVEYKEHLKDIARKKG